MNDGATRTRLYRNGVLECDDFPIADISEHLERDDTVVWADFCGPSKEQLHELASELQLHELAVEDALGPHQRPKVDYYETHLFLSCHDVRVDGDAGSLAETEIDAFVGSRWLVTVRKDDGFDIDLVERRWDRSTGLAKHGVSFLLYGLLDVVVDDYFAAVQGFDEFYDTISEAIFAGTPLDPAQQRRWFDMRRALVRFHRLVVPTREMVSSLMRRDHLAVADELEPYYQDVYDHTLRVGEATDSLRDLVSTIVETNLSLQDYRQNQIVKKVSSWAAIIAGPAFLTGYFGMNVPYPGSGETSGVIISTLLIVLLSAGLYVVFRRKDWL
jgi:magnesium transporter